MRLSNFTFERSAGSRTLAAAAQRVRSPHGDRFLKPEDTNGS